ncbi:hypothetical protein CPB84DRAFT_1849648 [Gymnopilus junonius]|uniref:BTB domain-containing protein n=1 Tax=Gymnopilus junonius TaxID=109634 RepID=A0A9P5NFX1_GYMJU|nr:hypothetical protein CPB84DRAFT_1849648 [Gymnopilus junonius]
MDINLKSGFAEWARDSIHDVIPDELRPVAQELPLWPSASNSLPLDIRPGSAVRMLPQDISVGIVSRFMNVCVADYGSLRFLRGPSLTLVQLMERLAFPPSLLVPDLIAYKELLGTLIPLLPSIYVDPVPIPDCSSLVKPSNELYARDRLFVAALYKHGLRTENELNVQMFLDCVGALNESEREQDDLVIRANVLFESYGYWLPMQITAQEQHRWKDLDDCSFIPRSMATHRHLEDQDITLPGLDIPQNVVALDAVVAPSDLVREEFEAIAWTQRAAFANQPHQRVVVAYPDLGRPTISEVATHLRYLSSLTNLSAPQRCTVLHDLEATYSFLNDNAPSAELILSQLGAMEIFLNVDDPEMDEWRWDKADELVFDSQDIDESMRHVRDFLMPFGRLLRATGVEQVSHAHFRSNSWNSIAAPENKLASIRLGFEDLRKKKLLADVIFKPSDHTEDSEPLVAHRSFLAVSSEYFSDLFCGDFKEGEPASAASPISIALPHHSTACARLVLDHIYTGAEPEAQTLTLDLLLEALKLSGFWDIKDLFKLLQKEIADNLVTPRTLNQIRTKATECHAEELIETCVDYEQRNAGLIQKYASRHARPPELELE